MIKYLLTFLVMTGFFSSHPMSLLKDLKEKSEGLHYYYHVNHQILICFSAMSSGTFSLASYALSGNTTITLASGVLSAAGTLYFLGWEGIDMKTRRQKSDNYWLALSAWHEDLDKINFFLNSGAQINEEVENCNPYGPPAYELICPLYAALSKNKLAAADLLRRHGADVDLKIGPFKQTMLMVFANNDRDDARPAMKWLIKAGADLNAKDINGRTAYNYACTGSRKAMLLEASTQVAQR